MPPRTLATLASVLAGARDADAALAFLYQEACEVERSTHVALFRCEPKRNLIVERITPNGDGSSRAPLNISIDHLPAPIRRALNGGNAIADFGSESADYIKLLGLEPQQEGGVLSVRGLTLDGELAGFVAIYEPRRRFAPRVMERLTPALDLFALTYGRIAEHDARFEAVQALEELTRKIHSEYNSTVRALKRELDDVRALAATPSERDAARIAELEKALKHARAEAQSKGERLAAVEEQVLRAVEKLDDAHRDLHAQTELARWQASVLYQIKRLLADQTAAPPEETLFAIRGVLFPRGH